MNGVAVLDASIAAKWFLPEPGSNLALALRDSLGTILVPDLIFAEMGNVLCQRVRRRSLSTQEAQTFIRLFRALPLYVHDSRSLIEDAVRIALEFGATAYDALYVGLALSQKVVFITADQKLLRLRSGRLERVIVSLEEAVGR